MDCRISQKIGIKLLELTQFLSPNLSIYFNFLPCWGKALVEVRCHVHIFKLTARAQSIYRDVYALCYYVLSPFAILLTYVEFDGVQHNRCTTNVIASIHGEITIFSKRDKFHHFANKFSSFSDNQMIWMSIIGSLHQMDLIISTVTLKMFFID